MKNSLAIFAILLLLAACKKEDDTVNPPPAADEILAGIEIPGITITNYDTIIIGGYNSLKTFTIDMDGNGIDDISFMSNIWGSPGVGMHPVSGIACLNSECSLFGFYSNDTTFINDTTSYYQYDTIIQVYHRIIESCHPVSDNDTIEVINYEVYKIIELPENGQIIKTGNFKSDTLTLIDDSFSYPPISSGEGTDTVTYLIYTYNNNCSMFSSDVIKYIGIKMTVNGTEKLGWIKLSITDKYKIAVYESALQD